MKAKDTRERIIRQALRYFIENDYEGASLNSIAEALGITKGAIYHYFGSKDELFKEAVLHVVDALAVLLHGMTTPERDVQEWLSGWFSFDEMVEYAAGTMGVDFFQDYGNQLYLMFTAIKKFPEVREKIHEVYSCMIKTMEKRFEQARQEGKLRSDIDPGALAFELTAFSEGALLLSVVLKDFDIEGMSRRSFTEFWNRIKP